MEVTALLLSRLQFAFTISFHIIFPSFSIGLAAWLTILEALYQATGRPAYRVVFEFWLKIFSVAFGMGVVSGIVMAFQFGTNWEVLARMVGPIQGVLLSYETFTAFFLEASFFGILLFGRSRVPPWFYLFSTAMVALGTTLSAFWIMANNSWMQAPMGYALENGAFVPTDWLKIVFSPVLWVRFPHMLLAAFITGAFCVAATGAWYLLRGKYPAEAHIMLRMGLFLAAILVPIQIFFGHLNGDYVHDYQPAKFAAIGALARRATGWRGVDRNPRSARGAQPLRNQGARPRQPDRQHELGFEGSWAYRFSARGSASRAHSVFCVSHHGRFRAHHARSRLDWIVSQSQGAAGAEPFAAVGDILELSAAVHPHSDGLVHGRSRTAALDGLWRVAHRGLRHSVSDDARGARLSDRLLPGLYIHFRLRCALHSSAAAHRSGRASG